MNKPHLHHVMLMSTEPLSLRDMHSMMTESMLPLQVVCIASGNEPPQLDDEKGAMPSRLCGVENACLPALLEKTPLSDVQWLSPKKVGEWLALTEHQPSAHTEPRKTNVPPPPGVIRRTSLQNALFTHAMPEAPARINDLSPKEWAVLQDLAAGLSISEIARQRQRSIKTISGQKRKALKRLGLDNDRAFYQWLAQ